jgi:CxxC-x17-CxxC domain-containing protein
MRKIIRRKSASEPTDLVSLQVETDLAGLINKIYEQLVALEKKVDTLISRSSDRAQDGDRFQKSAPRFRHSEHSDRGGARNDDRSREKNFTQAVCSSCGKECEIPFRPTGDRPVYCRDCFSARKDSGSFKAKFGNRSRERNFTRERNFDHRGEAKGQRFGKKKRMKKNEMSRGDRFPPMR